MFHIAPFSSFFFLIKSQKLNSFVLLMLMSDNCNEAVSYYRRDNPFSGTIGGLSLVPLITF